MSSDPNAAGTVVGSPEAVRHQYESIACGISPDLYLQVLGLGAAPNLGVPAVATVQTSITVNPTWDHKYTALTGAVSPAVLTKLVVCAGSNATEAVGLGSDGNIYLVGSQTAAWKPGTGKLTQTAGTTFATTSLAAQPINTVTVFAVTNAGAPWVAAYKDQSTQHVWQPGYALPTPNSSTYISLEARPDVSSLGSTHAIGLTADGKACEAAKASGMGVGVGNWTAGKGILGSVSGLPTFTQLLLVSGDRSGNFHVIGLGADGSVWDIDQYSATAAVPRWNGTSTTIAAAGSISGSKIAFYLSGTPSAIVLNLVAWAGSHLTVFAQFTTSWTSSTTTIPTSGVTKRWHIVNNLASGSGLLILGLSGPGLVYELACCNGGTWTAGGSNPIG